MTADPYPNPAPGAPDPRAAQLARLAEPKMEMYARQTRNATVTIAVFVVVSALMSVIVGILVAIAAAHFNAAYNQGGFGGSSNSNCLSQGGSDPSC